MIPTGNNLKPGASDSEVLKVNGPGRVQLLPVGMCGVTVRVLESRAARREHQLESKTGLQAFFGVKWVGRPQFFKREAAAPGPPPVTGLKPLHHDIAHCSFGDIRSVSSRTFISLGPHGQD